MRIMTFTRRINGKIYTWKAPRYKTKAEAKRSAESWRNYGYSARVIKTGHVKSIPYEVYLRKTHTTICTKVRID